MRRYMLAHAITKLRELQDRIDSGQVKEMFDLDHWWANVEYVDDERNECGTAGCFIGWACQENWFRDFGYELSLMQRREGRVKDLIPAFNGERCVNNREVERKLTEMFGFEYPSTIGFLIYSENYAEEKITPVVVAEQIESLLEVGEERFVESR